MSIGGTDSTSNIPFIVSSMDYSLIGEEIYAAGAYISEDPVMMGCISGQDIIKLVSLAIIIIGAILFQGGINIAPLFKI